MRGREVKKKEKYGLGSQTYTASMMSPLALLLRSSWRTLHVYMIMTCQSQYKIGPSWSTTWFRTFLTIMGATTYKEHCVQIKMHLETTDWDHKVITLSDSWGLTVDQVESTSTLGLGLPPHVFKRVIHAFCWFDYYNLCTLTLISLYFVTCGP